jgi:hypothetical protein
MEKSKKGCFIGHMAYNVLMYADDLVLLSISITDMQLMIDLCWKLFNDIGLDINFSKSSCIRIGVRHKAKVVDISVNGTAIPWKQQLDYLGMQIESALSFTVNVQKSRQKFFAALNTIFGKVGANCSPAVLISLIESQCVSILLYGSESVLWKSAMYNSFDNTLCQAYFKIFRTFDKPVAYQCMYFMGQLPMKYKIVKRKTKFLYNLRKSKSLSLAALMKTDKELQELINQYQLQNSNWHDQLRSIFKERLDQGEETGNIKF